MEAIRALRARTYRVPTDAPEADGTYAWESTTLVVVEAEASGGETGLGWTYADASAGALVEGTLAPVVLGQDALSVRAAWIAMGRAVRNVGKPGVAACAISAVDAALWDLKARILRVPLARLLGMVRPAVPLYGSGGFTTYSHERLRDQLGGWVDEGFRFVKMKVGTDPAADLGRVEVARDAVGDAALFVDANGAWSRKQALMFAEAFAELDVAWLEEPVSSDDLDGLRLLRDRAPGGMDVAAGEYGFDLPYFRRMLEAGAVDVLQADATRCLGISGFLAVASLCEAACMPMSAHCAPGLHLAVCTAAAPLVHLEWFHDHARIEAMLFDNMPRPRGGTLAPDLSAPGNGLTFRSADAARFAI